MGFFSAMDVQVQYKHHPLLLIFRNADLEKKFRSNLNLISVSKSRLAIILGILLYSGFSFLDSQLVPRELGNQLAIRLGLITPILFLMLLLTFLKPFQQRLQPIAAVSIFSAGFGHLLMPFYTVLPEAYIMSCTNLVIIFLFVFSGIRFATSLVISGILIPAYILTELFVVKIPPPALIDKLFFLISTAFIGMLAGYIIERSQRVEFAQKETIHEQHEHIEYELAMARKIQNQLIPSGSPVQYLSFFYHPMEQVGGDFVDFLSFEDSDVTGIFISDVSGHGVPAAFITSMLKSTLLQAGERRKDPALLLNYINEIIGNQTDGNFITALYGIFSKKDRSFYYANAGHNEPMIVGDDVQYLEGEKSCPLAVPWDELASNSREPMKNNTVILPENSKLLLYTDGFTEATSKNGETDFENSIMQDVLLSCRALPCTEFVLYVFKKLIDFSGRIQFSDDICIICLDT